MSGNDVDEGLVTVKTYGECAMTGDQSMFAFIGPLVALHGCLMIATNYLMSCMDINVYHAAEWLQFKLILLHIKSDNQR